MVAQNVTPETLAAALDQPARCTYADVMKPNGTGVHGLGRNYGLIADAIQGIFWESPEYARIIDSGNSQEADTWTTWAEIETSEGKCLVRMGWAAYPPIGGRSHDHDAESIRARDIAYQWYSGGDALHVFASTGGVTFDAICLVCDLLDHTDDLSDEDREELRFLHGYLRSRDNLATDQAGDCSPATNCERCGNPKGFIDMADGSAVCWPCPAVVTMPNSHAQYPPISGGSHDHDAETDDDPEPRTYAEIARAIYCAADNRDHPDADTWWNMVHDARNTTDDETARAYVAQALDDIAGREFTDPEEFYDIAADFTGDCYTFELLQWLARSNANANLYDEANAELGAPDSLSDGIMRAQAMAYDHAIGAIVRNWPDA